MAKFKDSGIPWIGMIPDDWEVCFTKQLMRNKSVKGFPNEQVLSLYREYGVVPKDSRDDNHNVTSEDTASYKLVEVGDFVINKMKAWQGSMGISAYRGIISPAYYICRFTNDNVNRRYIHYLLRNETYKTEYRRLSTGLRVGQWDLNIDDFLHIPAILPPLPTQQRIADFLDRKCAEIDELAALQETMIEELKRYKQSLITETVTKGLDPNAPMKESGVEWIGEIPEGWRVKAIKQEYTIVAGATPKSDNNENWDGNIPWITPADYTTEQVYIYGGKRNLSQNGYDSCSTVLLPKGCLIFSKRAPIGLVGINAVELCTNQGCVGCIPKNNVFTKYVYYSTSVWTEQFELYGRGTTFKEISANSFANFKLAFPPLTEQQQIADFLDRKCAEIDKLIAVKQQKIEALKEYKKSVIFEYVTGKKEVEL